MMTYTRSEIREYRQKWIDVLIDPETKKADGTLDRGNGARCCLGHACFALGIESRKKPGLITPPIDEYFQYRDGKDWESYYLPYVPTEMLGMWTHTGATAQRKPFPIGEYEEQKALADYNDMTKITPQEIGQYLLTVIEGGEDTPFRPLTDYPE